MAAVSQSLACSCFGLEILSLPPSVSASPWDLLFPTSSVPFSHVPFALPSFAASRRHQGDEQPWPSTTGSCCFCCCCPGNNLANGLDDVPVDGGLGGLLGLGLVIDDLVAPSPTTSHGTQEAPDAHSGRPQDTKKVLGVRKITYVRYCTGKVRVLTRYYTLIIF